jgi:ATP-binding cassette subfamily B protein
VRDIGVERARVGQLFFLGMGIAGAIGTALIYWAGGHLVLSDAITAGTIVAFVAYLGRLYGPISSLSNVQVEFSSSMVSFERVFEYLDMPIEVQDKPGAKELAAVQGRIEFEDVSFSYLAKERDGERLPDGMPVAAQGPSRNDDTANEPDAGEAPVTSQQRLWALQDVNFTIEPGELVALVGPSGAGKTTITYLLPRLYDPTAGAIRLDGLDIREVTQMSLARQIGMVMQETYLFHDTILANLLYARPKATQAEVEAACRAANIHEFIASLPNGYLTVAGERGYRLSGGEKQRLAIARVVLKDPAILVLDEATSHLDSQSEALIQTALEPLMKGRTSIVIAHRLSTILAADKILVMNRGQVMEAGTHRQLLDMGGLYAELYETQFRLQAMLEA